MGQKGELVDKTRDEDFCDMAIKYYLDPSSFDEVKRIPISPSIIITP